MQISTLGRAEVNGGIIVSQSLGIWMNTRHSRTVSMLYGHYAKAGSGAGEKLRYSHGTHSPALADKRHQTLKSQEAHTWDRYKLHGEF